MLINEFASGNPQVSIIVLTQYGRSNPAIEATRLGATDYITKPFHVAGCGTKLDRLCILLDGTGEQAFALTLRKQTGFGGLKLASPREGARGTI